MDERSLRLRSDYYDEIMPHFREKHPEMIDAAYEFFWDEEDPEEFLGGISMELGFLNFEDWFLCDWVAPDHGNPIEIYIKEKEIADSDKLDAFGRMRRSVLSLFEVESLARQGKFKIKDLLLGGTVELSAAPADGMASGDIFGARLLELKGSPFLGACLYPFTAALKGRALEYVQANFNRYSRNKKPGADMREFLKEEAYSINLAWTSCLLKKG
ncbi:MAG: hypothetical protein M0018_11695 [Nitrospiraceae bacterium]|nr:hypothetical protein [Nitrospiraceae bacterium]